MRSVVPKPGIVTPIIPFLSRLSLSKAKIQTKRASVESSPPLIPITTLLPFMCFKRFTKPRACMFNISLKLWSLSSPVGIKGCGSIALSSSKTLVSRSKQGIISICSIPNSDERCALM